MSAHLFYKDGPSYREVVDKFVSEFGSELISLDVGFEDQFGNSTVEFLKRIHNGKALHARLPSVADKDRAIPIELLGSICRRLKVPLTEFEPDFDDL